MIGALMLPQAVSGGKPTKRSVAASQRMTSMLVAQHRRRCGGVRDAAYAAGVSAAMLIWLPRHSNSVPTQASIHRAGNSRSRSAAWRG
jgi:hypothetical protein